MPDVVEYFKEMILAFEKEVLGIYLSGHPMEAYQEIWRKYSTNTTNDFLLDEESGTVSVEDQANVVMGGMIADKTVKYTKNDKVMAFLHLEDLVGNVEVVVFSRDYEKYSSILQEEAKIFILGHASVEEDRDGKLICEQIVSFDEAEAAGGGPIFRSRRWNSNNYSNWQGNGGQGKASYSEGTQGNLQGKASYPEGTQGNSQGEPSHPDNSGAGVRNAALEAVKKGKMPKGIWLQFPDADSYFAREKELLAAIADSHGNDNVVIYLKSTRGMKVLPSSQRVSADERLQEKLGILFGAENVKIR